VQPADSVTATTSWLPVVGAPLSNVTARLVAVSGSPSKWADPFWTGALT
jgi:hypothetical protein